MTREEITKKIEELEKRQFFHMMKDHWTVEDNMFDTRLTNEIRELKRQLEEN